MEIFNMRAALKRGRGEGIWIRMGLEKKLQLKATFSRKTMEHLLSDRHSTEGFREIDCF